MAQKTTFMTGASGFLGSELLRRVLARESDTFVYVLMRGVDEAAAGERLDALLDDLFTDRHERQRMATRVQSVHGDVCSPRLGVEAGAYQQLVNNITDVYHLASDVRFNLPLEGARAINMGGASNVLELALASSRARRHAHVTLHHVSTYAAGRPTDSSSRIYEELTPLNGTAHNTYEQSKLETEHMLVERAGNVCLYIYRPSIIVGDSRTGWTQDFKVSYLLMRSYFSYSSEVPLLLSSSGRIDQVNIDYVADALHFISRSTDDCSGTIYNLVAGAGALASAEVFGQFAQALRELACQHDAGSVPPVLRIELTETLTETDLRSRIADPGVLKLMLEFLPYFGNTWLYDDTNTQRILTRHAGAAGLKPEINVKSLAAYCLLSQWGRRRGNRPSLEMSFSSER